MEKNGKKNASWRFLSLGEDYSMRGRGCEHSIL